MNKYRILRQPYLDLSQEMLGPYVCNLLERCAEEPSFTSLQPRLDAVKAAADVFMLRLQERVDGGRDRTIRKNQARDTLHATLEGLIREIDAGDLSEDAIRRAGFVLPAPRKWQAGIELAPPEIRAAAPLGNGTVRFDFVNRAGRYVQAQAIEWSTDGGATWQSGTFAKRSPVKLAGLPTPGPALVRMCSIGTHGRRSVWTMPVAVYVW